MKKKKKIIVCLIVGCLAGILNGLFGSGGGTFVVPFMTEYLKIDDKKAHATAIFIILFFTLISLIFYGINSFLDLRQSLWVSLGGLTGGLIGAKLLSKLSSGIVRKIFGSFMIIAALRMVFK